MTFVAYIQTQDNIACCEMVHQYLLYNNFVSCWNQRPNMTEVDRIELDSQKGYALWAESYDREKNPLIAVEEPHVENLLKDITYSYVLDAGTGTGRWALKLAKQGAFVTAIDSCPDMLGIAIRKSRESKLDIDFHQASLEEELSFDANQFELVLSTLVLSHVPNLTQKVKEFHRVCKKDGHLLITDCHPDTLAEGWRPEFDKEGIAYQIQSEVHTRERYLETIRKAGFVILEVVDVPTREIPEGYVTKEIIDSYGDLGLCLIILCQKP